MLTCPYCDKEVFENDPIALLGDVVYHKDCKEDEKKDNREAYLKETYPHIDLGILKTYDKDGGLCIFDDPWVVIFNDFHCQNVIESFYTKKDLIEELKSIVTDVSNEKIAIYHEKKKVDFSFNIVVNITIED